MNFTVLEGQEITNIEKTDNGISFVTKIQELEAIIEVEGIETVTLNGEEIDIKSIEDRTIMDMEIDVVEFSEDTFSAVNITTEDGDEIKINGDMKGTILNVEDFEELIAEMSGENEDEDYDEDYVEDEEDLL